MLIDKYNGMSDCDIDEHFRMGWIAHQDGSPQEEDYPYAWREGWSAAQASNLNLTEEQDERTKKANVGRNNRVT